ncbi:uncharacterized protein LOC127439222 isoform X2 [Myxocyprinus asiaticus]|uniref:uncharacterized protein LOC127439222 isoform X2 n=1 Tax=Myxocyprinus asiaticus TaxID=70543 RepID=UPI002222FF5B|nr:uncharacterized protein LOC127439222 isoform X2 [Myxocyprinus asiaticus]
MENILLALSLLLINGVSGDEITAKVGETITLNTGVNKTKDQTILWYFEGVLIAQFNGDPKKSCLYDGVNGKFKDILQEHMTEDRLQEHKNGDLTIKNVKVEHSGQYEANSLIKNPDGKTQLFRNSKTPNCNSTKIRKEIIGIKIKTVTVTVSESNMESRVQEPTSKTSMSSDTVTGICVGVLLVVAVAAAVAAGMIFYQRRNHRKYPEKNTQALMVYDEKMNGV